MSELQGAPALESLKLPCQKTQVEDCAYDHIQTWMIIGDYQEELGGQHQHQHQEQVKGEAKDAMERLLPPRPSSSNSCNHHYGYGCNYDFDCDYDDDEFDGH